jgi:uncharacterized membrane protein HdeD (DUF308 family)
MGIIFIILGLIFAIYPMYSAEAVSWIAGICLICFGFSSIIDGFSVWSMMAHVSLLNILLGIFAILLGLLFIYQIDALSFLVGYKFYFIAFVLILIGLFGIFFAIDTLSRIISVFILILGFAGIYLAFFSITQPLYVAIIVGICLIMEGILFLTTSIAES